MMQTDFYAVFGSPISHSKSPQIHQLFAIQTGHQISYTAQEVTAETFNTAADHFFNAGGKGLNCTLPLKELAWQRADRLTERAQMSKAVNTLLLQEDGYLLGDNTDGLGLVVDLSVNLGVSISGKRILILGAGGACRGILHPLQGQCPHCITIANRTVAKAEILANEFTHQGQIEGCSYDDLKGNQFDIIINATSASLTNQLPPLPDNLLTPNAVCYDLAYANTETPFVRWGQQNNAAISIDGLGMLVEQAAAAFYLWRNIQPLTSSVIDQLNADRLTDMMNQDMENISNELNLSDADNR